MKIMSKHLSDLTSIIESLDAVVDRPTRPGRRKRSFKRLKGRLKRFGHSWTWESVEVHSKMVSKNDQFIGASDLSDFVCNRIMLERADLKVQTSHKSYIINATEEQWFTTMEPLELRHVPINDTYGIYIDDYQNSFLKYDINHTSVTVKSFGDKSFIDRMYNLHLSYYQEVKNVIEWIYSADGRSIDIPVLDEKKPVEEMYPFLNGELLSEYYDRYINSSASILLLIGPPGTGKTTFIRGLLQHAKISAMVTYDTSILSKDFIFADFIDGDRNALIVEDADNFLGSRTNGNDFMHKFLNVGDGLVTTKDKKMIFSTNLPSIKDVDPALVRPGRCFDVIHFDNLTHEQAEKLADRIGVELDSNKLKWSIADIFHRQNEPVAPVKQSFGFV